MAKKKRVTLFDIALAFARANHLAGIPTGRLAARSDEERARNMIAAGYLKAGDPGKWIKGKSVPLATVYGERRGGEGDCEPPIDHDERWPVLAGDLWWEWHNAALGHVYSDTHTELVDE